MRNFSDRLEKAIDLFKFALEESNVRLRELQELRDNTSLPRRFYDYRFRHLESITKQAVDTSKILLREVQAIDLEENGEEAVKRIEKTRSLL
jgi:hypothetical protein